MLAIVLILALTTEICLANCMFSLYDVAHLFGSMMTPNMTVALHTTVSLAKCSTFCFVEEKQTAQFPRDTVYLLLKPCQDYCNFSFKYKYVCNCFASVALNAIVCFAKICSQQHEGLKFELHTTYARTNWDANYAFPCS